MSQWLNLRGACYSFHCYKIGLHQILNCSGAVSLLALWLGYVVVRLQHCVTGKLGSSLSNLVYRGVGKGGNIWGIYKTITLPFCFTFALIDIPQPTASG